MNIFFTSDHHFDHKPIMGYTNRPFATVEEMNEHIIKVHNETVKPGDRCYFIGDFAWRNHAHFAKRLNGHKVLLIGNHDKQNTAGLSAFDDVYDVCRTQVAKQKIIMCHFPMESWWNCGGGSWMLHGHTHRISLVAKKRLYVGVDQRRDMAPWSFDELVEFMKDLPRY